MNISLEKLTNAIPANTFSITVELSEKGQAEDHKATAEALETIAEALREATTPDRGMCIDMRGVKRLNESYQKALLSFVKSVIKKNVIGLDIRTDKKPAKEVAQVINEINELTKKSPSSSVRIKKHESKHALSFSWISYIVGVVVAIIGMFYDDGQVETKWFTGVSPVVLIGGAMVLIGALPHISKQYAMFRNKKDDNGSTS